MFLLLPKGLANIVPIPIQIFVENANNLFQFQSQTTQRKSQFFFSITNGLFVLFSLVSCTTKEKFVTQRVTRKSGVVPTSRVKLALDIFRLYGKEDVIKICVPASTRYQRWDVCPFKY